MIENASCMINKSIELQIVEEYAIGGLFNQDAWENVQEEIYNNFNWEVIGFHALNRVMALPQNRHLPILQGAIASNAPPHIIKGLVREYNCFVNVDSEGLYPIDIAVDYGISWDNGMQEIVEAFISSQQPSTVLSVSMKNGLEWEDGMQAVVNGIDVDEIDVETGLYPFMFAATEGGNNCDLEWAYYDLEWVFHLIKRNPLLVRQVRVQQ